MSEITRYPLCWPNNVPRTAPQSRSYPQFNEPTLYKAITHVLAEINRLNKRRHDYSDASVIISCNLRRNQDGSISGNQIEPADPGIAIYFKLVFLRGTREGS